MSADWMADKDRAPWVSNSLLARVKEMRVAERRCRAAFTKPYMGEPAAWLADVYQEVADLFERRLRDIKVAETMAYAKSQPADDASMRQDEAVQSNGLTKFPLQKDQEHG